MPGYRAWPAAEAAERAGLRQSAALSSKEPRTEQANYVSGNGLSVIVYRVGPCTVRVRVRRDQDTSRSSAAAELLTPALAWTEIAVDPPENWHPQRPSPAAQPAPATIAFWGRGRGLRKNGEGMPGEQRKACRDSPQPRRAVPPACAVIETNR